MPKRLGPSCSICVIVLFLACLVPVPTAADVPTKLYVGHAARLTAQIPIEWRVDPGRKYDYIGEDGFVLSEPIVGDTLGEACATAASSVRFDATGEVVDTSWSGQAACQIEAQIDESDVLALVVPHPDPFETWAGAFSYAALVADSDHFAAIVATLDFSPELVTLEAFVLSVIDIVEARAYWSAGVDWSLIRSAALAEVGGLSTLAEAYEALETILASLRAVGDNHSFLVPPGPGNPINETKGYGLLIGGRQVLIVYPDGPAERAGARAGDIIETVDGRTFTPTSFPTDPIYLWQSDVTLTLRHPGAIEAVTVSIGQGPYSQYLPPTGRPLADGIGYLNLYGFTAFGQEADYAAAARRVIRMAEMAPTCGWVIDLRLNTGGSYFPMITGVGPILGNGAFLGWLRADGVQTWVRYEDGRILEEGFEPIDYLPDEESIELRRPNPPVAVLISGMTVSSGEIAALAFVGRPGARLFGEPTGGLTTGNAAYDLFDGSVLLLAESAMTDRTGETHPDGVMPDKTVPVDWTRYGTDDDRALDAAIEWLNQQPACTSSATPVSELQRPASMNSPARRAA